MRAFPPFWWRKCPLSVIFNNVLIALVPYFHLCAVQGNEAGHCCAWAQARSITSIEQIFSVPQSPADLSCISPYSWESCENEAACYSAVCTLSVIQMSGYVSTCSLSPESLNALVSGYGVQCTISQGIFRRDETQTSSQIDSTTETTETQSSSQIGTSMLVMTTNVSITAVTYLSAESPSSSLNTTSKISTNTDSAYLLPNLPYCIFSPTSKRRSWLSSDQTFETQPPTARESHRFATVNDKLYMFGGKDDKGIRDELFEFNPSGRTWADLTDKVQGPKSPPRYLFGMAAQGTKIYAHGGNTDTGVNGDLYLLDTQALTWADLTNEMKGSRPLAREGHGLREAKGKLYLFGGRLTSGLINNELYMLDPTSVVWTRLALPGAPPPRMEMCFESSEKSLWVFGGVGDTYGKLGDLFEFDVNGLVWRNLQSVMTGAAPSARSSSAFIHFHGSIFLFGGIFDSELDSSLFEFNISTLTWTQREYNIEGVHPSVRIRCAYTAINGSFFIHGGWIHRAGIAVIDNGLYRVDPSSGDGFAISNSVRGSGPPAKSFLSGQIIGNDLFLFGGVEDSSATMISSHQLDMSVMVWQDLGSLASGDVPSPRWRAGVTSASEMLYLFGGSTHAGYVNDIYQFQPNRQVWTDMRKQLSGLPPFERSGHGFTSLNGSLYIFGGEMGENPLVLFGDLYKLDLSAMQWVNLTTSTGRSTPPARCGHGLSSTSGLLFLFGGLSEAGGLSDMWHYDPSVAVWTEVTNKTFGTGPSARWSFGFTSTGASLYVFGGLNSGDVLNDLYELNTATMTWSLISEAIAGSPPSPRYGASLTASTEKLIIFGGTDSAGRMMASLSLVSLPQSIPWPENGNRGGFVEIYDWDTVVIDNATASDMFYTLQLCTGVLPCCLKVVGNAVTKSTLQGINQASLICSNGAGCAGVLLENLILTCNYQTFQDPVIQVQSSNLSVVKSSFHACSSMADGGIIQASDSAAIRIFDTRFQDLYTQGHGAAIALIGGFLRAESSAFQNCSSAMGGGALWASAYACFGSGSARNAILEIQSSSFRACKTSGNGGAISVDSSIGRFVANVTRAHVAIDSSVFTDCQSEQNGGAVNTNGGLADLEIRASQFMQSKASKYGGAISTECSSTIMGASFLYCVATAGGGAIFAFSSQTSSERHKSDIMLSILSTTFQECSCGDTGGAIFASSVSDTDQWLHLMARNATFRRCRSAGSGGALMMIGPLLNGTVEDSLFLECSASTAGGAVSAAAKMHLSLNGAMFVGNEANGLGGGALHLLDAQLQSRDSACSRNMALAGGGGVVLLQGDSELIDTGLRSGELQCGDSNFASYGPCVASTFEKFAIEGFPTSGSWAYPGLAVNLTVKKMDRFQQIIKADSSSLLQLRADQSDILVTGISVSKLQKGVASFQLALDPVYLWIDYDSKIAMLSEFPKIYVHGTDSALKNTLTIMRSEPAPFVMSNFSSICPTGYVLALNPAGFAKCSLCGQGTYSLNALVGLTQGAASCLACPPDANCTGGSAVAFAKGTWISSEGIYKLIGCPAGHQLVNMVNGKFNQGVQQCVVCLPSEYILNPNSSEFTCQTWNAPAYAALTLLLEGSLDDSNQLKLAFILANLVLISVQKIRVASASESRRSTTGQIRREFWLAADNATDAARISAALDISDLKSRLAIAGIPSVLTASVQIVTSSASREFAMTNLSAVFVSAIGCILFSVVGLCWLRRWNRLSAHQALLSSVEKSEVGSPAPQSLVPYPLRGHYVAESVLGRGATGCVFRARKNGAEGAVAVKLIIPESKRFQEQELRRFQRECSVLEMFTSQRCEHAVHMLTSGEVRTEHKFGWIIMELLDGENLSDVISTGPLMSVECIKAARSVLAALKLMHAEGVIHRDIKPSNIIRCRAERQKGEWDGHSYVYKLIDFGTAVGIDDRLAKDSMMTLSASALQGAGTLPYMSPEMYLEPDKATYSTDLWSLGVTLFELATGILPFQATDTALWSSVIARNLDERAPNVLDKIDEARRARFDNNLAKVISKALEKKIADRYQTVDEMHQAVYDCLIATSEACYSVFISYRVATEAPLARLLFDELNHTVTPGGHRVTVYWDAYRLVKGEDWEEGFTNGLLNSICFFPLLSYGSTAPLAALPSSKAARTAVIEEGWEEFPAGRRRLEGLDSDPQDNVLKEFLIAGSLLERKDAEHRNQDERGMLQIAYPILVGRQHPKGHPRYPSMGNFFHVQEGGGKFSKRPSMPTNTAVGALLREKAHFPESVIAVTETWSVESAANNLTKLQGCQLWTHAPDLKGVPLTKEQKDLVGKGYCGPAVDLEKIPLTDEQMSLCTQGLDEAQLEMLKAQVRAKVPDFHAIIDRAVAQSERAAQSASDVQDASVCSSDIYTDVDVPSLSAGFDEGGPHLATTDSSSFCQESERIQDWTGPQDIEVTQARQSKADAVDASPILSSVGPAILAFLIQEEDDP